MADMNPSHGGTEQHDRDSSQAFEKAFELPFNQMLSFQKMAAEVVRNGLEMSNRAQSQNIQVTKDTLDSYIETLDRTTRETEKLAEQGAEQFQEVADAQQQLGQQQLGQSRNRMEEFGQQFRGSQQAPRENQPQTRYQQPTQQGQGQQSQPGHRSGQPQQAAGGQSYRQPDQQAQGQYGQPQPEQYRQASQPQQQYQQGTPLQQGRQAPQPRTGGREQQEDWSGVQGNQQPFAEQPEEPPASW